MCLFCSCRSFLKFGVRTGRRKSSWWPKTMLNLFQKVSDFCLFIYFLSSWRDRILHSQIINIYIFKSSHPLAIVFVYIYSNSRWMSFSINYEAVCRIKKTTTAFLFLSIVKPSPSIDPFTVSYIRLKLEQPFAGNCL